MLMVISLKHVAVCPLEKRSDRIDMNIILFTQYKLTDRSLMNPCSILPCPGHWSIFFELSLFRLNSSGPILSAYLWYNVILSRSILKFLYVAYSGNMRYSSIHPGISNDRQDTCVPQNAGLIYTGLYQTIVWTSWHFVSPSLELTDLSLINQSIKRRTHPLSLCRCVCLSVSCPPLLYLVRT